MSTKKVNLRQEARFPTLVITDDAEATGFPATVETLYRMRYEEVLHQLDLAEYNLLVSVRVQLNAWAQTTSSRQNDRTKRERAKELLKRIEVLDNKMNPRES